MKLIAIFFLSTFISINATAQTVKICNFDFLSKAIHSGPDTVKVVNFWATWCKPCVEEMKYFKEATSHYKNSKVKFIFVSLDFKSQKERVEEFKIKQGITGSFYLLADDPNKWINKIDSSWAGDLPYTLLVAPDGKTSKINRSIQQYDELEKAINSFLK